MLRLDTAAAIIVLLDVKATRLTFIGHARIDHARGSACCAAGAGRMRRLRALIITTRCGA